MSLGEHSQNCHSISYSQRSKSALFMHYASHLWVRRRMCIVQSDGRRLKRRPSDVMCSLVEFIMKMLESKRSFSEVVSFLVFIRCWEVLKPCKSPFSFSYPSSHPCSCFIVYLAFPNNLVRSLTVDSTFTIYFVCALLVWTDRSHLHYMETLMDCELQFH